MDEKITVIIPIFNGEEYLEKTLNSLFNQTFGFENIEVIIVDDYSTDNTANLMKDYANKYPNIKCFFLEKNNGTPGKGRNIGIQNASADFLMFLDSDDELAPDMCEIMYSTITNENVDFVSCRYDVYVNNQFISHNKSFLDNYDSKIKITSITDNIEMISTCSNLMVWNKIYKKEFILANNMSFLDDEWCEDLLFEYEAYLNAKSFISLNDYYGYRYHSYQDSASHSNAYKTFVDGISALGKIEQFFKAKNFKHFEVVNEYLVIWTQSMLFSDFPNSQKKYLFEQMKPYYKRYSLFYRLVNNVSLPFNMVINVLIKLFSLSVSFAVFTTNVYKYFLKFRGQ